jgi:hypothetical protein
MVEEALRVVEAALSQDVQANVIINNRSGGNAPHVARLIAERFLERRRAAP